MAVTYGFFNATLKEGEYDRKYNADQLSEYFRGIVGEGVLANVSDGLQVVAGSGLKVQVKPGRAFLQSKWVENDAIMDIAIDAAHVTLNRYTAVIMTLDYDNREITFSAKNGENASTPNKPAMTRNESKREYCLAYVYVGRGATTISQSNIEDTRGNSLLCGYVTGLINQAETSTLFIQYQTAFEEDRTSYKQKNETALTKNNADFNAWFDGVKDTIARSTLIRAYEHTYTAAEEETDIPIGVSQYVKDLDVLQVYINGMKLIPDEDFSIPDNKKIILTKAVYGGTPISFVVYKSIDGSEAETVVSQVATLQNEMNDVKPEADKVPVIENDVAALKADSGWIALPISVVPTPDANNKPECRKLGKMVYVRGIISKPSLLVPFATLPEGFRPERSWHYATPLYISSPQDGVTTFAVAGFEIDSAGNIRSCGMTEGAGLTDRYSLNTCFPVE